MRKILFLVAVFCFQFFYLQIVALNKVVKTNENKDKFLYKIEDFSKSEFLGEILVNAYSNEDVEIFSDIYKKAKQIGANTFALKPIENIDGTIQKFNPAYYFLNLYYTNAEEIPNEENVAYLISSSDKSQKININNQTIELQARSFLKLDLTKSEIMSVSTRKLLGSMVKLSSKSGQPSLYLSLTNFKIHSNDSIYGGVNFKSGDITGLEKSFGMFLTTIYTEQKKD
ncbi:MAG: hypothetical protein L6262_04790 [Weeksellaceae bacterium]|nr:hypothetical protein [Weeksellaceae bacterium]